MAGQITEAIGEYDPCSVPDRVRETTKDCILDTVGCLIAGNRRESTIKLREITDWRGAGRKALFGGAAAHSVEMDDFHNGATVHPGVVVIPAALDAALGVGADGTTFLDAVVIGYETAIRVGLCGKGTYYERGFHATSVAGVFGAAAAAGYIHGLSERLLDNAFGIAGSNAGGLLEYKSNGSWTKRLQVGMAAQTGVRAVALSDGGLTGPSTILDGRHGFLEAYAADSDAEPVDPPWEFTSVNRITHKPYACCRYSDAAIDAFADAWARFDNSVGDIDGVTVETHAQAVESTAKPRARKRQPKESVDAQFSLPFVLGVTAVHGAVLPHHLTNDALHDDWVLGVAEHVDVNATSEFTAAYPAKNAARVTITAGGRTETTTVNIPTGDPERPLSRTDLRTKFDELTAPSLTDTERLADRLLSIETEPDLTFLEPLWAHNGEA